MRRHPRVVSFLWRWHRRLGLLAALLALLLAVTGITLNHSDDLGLDSRFVDWPWLYRLYGENTVELPAYRAGKHWIYRSGAGRVYVDQIELAPCRGELVGAASEGILFAACSEELLLATGSGELVESVSATTGLPVPLSGIGLADGRLVIQAQGKWWLADLDRLEFDEPARSGVIIEQLAPGELPQSLRAVLPGRDAWLNWERVLLDLHSGRLGGRLGVWLMDTAGLMLSLLGLSGVAMWFLHRRARNR
jgi:hypothetical protein